MPFWLQIACATLCCTAVASAPVEPVEHGSGVGVINIVGDALSETHNWEKGFGKKRKKREVNPCDDNGCTPTIIGSDSVWAYDADTSDEFEFDSVGDISSLKWKQEIGGWKGAFIRVFCFLPPSTLTYLHALHLQPVCFVLSHIRNTYKTQMMMKSL